ncbi:MBL fold metallo-hydrolase [Cyanobium sp. ATX 6A2]|jgi:L-ascorbate metabolism protein UlaG (beta-lactamase superfamily)|uniref:MBL fold metallo-hydrolase n=1 Tax=Cyanobium sp. ATX 6A2 TaxID=2823700 RepID=UPI0037C0CCF3|nr:MBL fold metallo-hydrolase [Cyanobium sp. ATX 6A2]
MRLLPTLAATAVALPAVVLQAMALPPAAAASGVSITSYGHSALLIQGSGTRVLLNPFKAVGCAAGLPEPRVSASVILASSRLLDEGAPVASGRFLADPGSFQVGGLRIEGLSTPRDRLGGRRFGRATIWRWQQGGLSFVHMGGTAGPLTPADKVMLSRPDVLILGVGGGAKVFDGAEAAEVVRELRPRVVIPVQYVSGAVPANCDQGGVEPFLQAMSGTPVQRPGRTVNLPGSLGEGPTIKVLR